MFRYFAFLNFLHRRFVRPGEADPVHQVFPRFQSLVGQIESPSVLEIGARNVTGVTRRHMFPSVGRYVGFDIHPGAGVDVVGDAHKLSTYFPANSFDAVFAFSVFEHLVFPWKAALEINRILKPGGYVFIHTHPAWPEHEMPWDFWRFPVGGLSSLFIRDTGFEVVEAREGLPCKVYSLVTDAPTRPLYRYTLNMMVAVTAKKVSDYDTTRFKWDIDVSEVLSTMYPKPT